MKRILHASSAGKAQGVYSLGVVATGKQIVFLSGQVPLDAKGDLVGKGDIEAQTRQVLNNLKALMEEAGGSMADITKLTLYVVDISPETLDVTRKVRQEFFIKDYPASTYVQIKSLVSPDWLIEIEAFAIL